MSKYTTHSFRKSYKHALNGIMVALKSQKNFKIELFIATLAIISALAMKFDIIETCILIIVIAGVLSAEIINSVIEFTLDAVYKNKYSSLVKFAKDLSAGAVLITTIAAFCVGVLLYVNKFIYILNYGVQFLE